MASKKGIAVTIIILAAITGVSFLFWLVPQENQMSVVISDHENYLDGIKEIHSILDDSIATEFENLKEGEITPEEYSQIADVTSSQLTSKISEFVTSKPPNEWQDSYIWRNDQTCIPVPSSTVRSLGASEGNGPLAGFLIAGHRTQHQYDGKTTILMSGGGEERLPFDLPDGESKNPVERNRAVILGAGPLWRAKSCGKLFLSAVEISRKL